MPAIIGAAIGAGVSALNNIVGKKNQNDQNKFNAEQAQLNREFQEQMWEKQVAYNNEMWEKNNEYNTPANQVARLKEAGINPAFAMGNVASGQVSSQAQGTGTPSGASASSSGTYRPDFSGISQNMQFAYDYMLRSAKNKAEIDSIQLNNDYQRASFDLRLREQMAKARKTLGEAEIAEINARWQDNMNWSKFNLDFASAQTQNAQAENIMQQTLILQQELDFLPYKQQLEAARILSEITCNRSKARLTDQQKLTEFQKTWHEHYKGVHQWRYNKIIKDNLPTIKRIIKNYSSQMNPYYGAFKGLLPNASFKIR